MQIKYPDDAKRETLLTPELKKRDEMGCILEKYHV